MSLRYYRRLLQMGVNNVEIWNNLGLCCFYASQCVRPPPRPRRPRRARDTARDAPARARCRGGSLTLFSLRRYDFSLSCFERSLQLADDVSDVWYNVGQVAIGIGDLGLAYQAFKISISVDSNHAESYANLGVLELRKGNIDAARSNFRTVQSIAPHMFEPFFNGALLAYKLGDFQEAYDLASKALEIFPEHHDSMELLKQLRNHFTML